MKTVFVYVNTSKQVGDRDHVKVFANVDAAEKWFEENDPGCCLQRSLFRDSKHRDVSGFHGSKTRSIAVGRSRAPPAERSRPPPRLRRRRLRTGR
jgi:hypothetical protein